MLKARLESLSNTGSINQQTIMPISSEDQTILDSIIGTVDTLSVQVQTTFTEMVTFAKSVIFK